MSYRILGANVSPFVRKVRVVMAEKSLDYELEPINPAQPTDEFLRRSPLGRIPVLCEGSGDDEIVIPDSSVICDYLERRHPEPALVPEDPVLRARTLWLEEHADGGLIPKVGPAVFRAVALAQVLGREPDVEGANVALREEAPKYLDYYEQELADDGHFVDGRLTLADIAIASPFVNLRHSGAVVPSERWPKLAAFLEDMFARPSFAGCIAEEEMFHRPADLSWGP